MAKREGIAVSEMHGAAELLALMKGPEFKDANKALRQAAKSIAAKLVPEANEVVSASQAHAAQVQAVVATGQAVADRVPTIAYGRKVLKLSHRDRNGRTVPFRRSGSNPRKRSNAIANGIVGGPRGGKRATSADENYYGIPRDPSGGAVGRALLTSTDLHRKAADEYQEAFMKVLRDAGWPMGVGR